MSEQARPASDAVARAVIAAFKRAFPGRLRAAYILGSYADATAAPTSDLDLTLVFRGAFRDHRERDAAQRLGHECAAHSPLELDIEIDDQTTLARGVSPNLKFASALIYGDDIRNHVPLVSLEEWTRDRMHTSWWRIARLFARPAVIVPPLEYPEPDEPFLGYTRRTVSLPDGRVVPCTRDLIRMVGWAATALLALDRGEYTPSKREVATLYGDHIGGPWASFIAELYTNCRGAWNYLIPDDPVGRARLHALCEQTLPFERHFLARYLPYLRAELLAGGPRALKACEVLLHAPLAQPEIEETLRTLLETNDSNLVQAAQASLATVSDSAQLR